MENQITRKIEHSQPGAVLPGRLPLRKVSQLLLCTLSFTLFTIIYAQTAAITNITVAQRTDGSRLVDVCYDLTGDINFNTFTISAEASFDGGVNYTPISMVSGTIGANIAEGLNNCFVWDFGTEAGELYTTTARIRLTADSSPVPTGVEAVS